MLKRLDAGEYFRLIVIVLLVMFSFGIFFLILSSDSENHVSSNSSFCAQKANHFHSHS